MKILLIALTVLCVLVPTFGQRKTLARSKFDLRLVRSKASIFVSFEHAGNRQPLKAGESSEGIWLRLHNNTRATVFLPTFSVPKELGETGMFYDVVSTAYTDDYHDPSVPTMETKIQYLPVGYRLGHTSGAYLLRPGRSVLFSVPREHLPERVALKIAFNYEWELEDKMGPVRIGEPEHFVFFYSSSVPK